MFWLMFSILLSILLLLVHIIRIYLKEINDIIVRYYSPWYLLNIINLIFW
jgi:hypothetical protein